MESKRGFKRYQYLRISQDHLVALSLWFLMEGKKQTSFENLVAESFSCFPDRFQLEGYPEWPNAQVVNRAWVRCRTDKKWITGSASEGFSLTPLGENVATKTLKALGVKAPVRDESRHGSRQSISSRVVLRVEKSAAFRAYSQSCINSVSEFDFCDLLYCTLGSTPEVLERNLSVVRQEVDSYGRRDLVKFLDALKQRFSNRLTGKRARGGLMPQKKEN